jgi:tetratricopeptide (TPR) repeat protein
MAPLWLALVVFSAVVVTLLRSYSVPLIAKIEYATTNPYTLALIYAEEGKKYYEKSLKKMQELRRQGQDKLLSKDDPDLVHARRIFLHSLSLNPENKALYSYLADLAGFEGDLATVHYYQGLISAASGAPDRAIQELDAALKIDPHKTDAQLKKSEILIAHDRLDDAEKTLRDVLASPQETGASDAYYQLARIAALRRDSAGAIELLRRSLSKRADNIAAAKMLAEYLSAANDKEGAITVLRAAQRFAPQDANVKHRLGRLLYDVQRYEEAAKTLESAEKIEHFSASLYLDLARTYRKLGKERLATLMTEKAMKLDPTLRDKVLNE